MNQIAAWLRKEFQAEALSFVENRSHGQVFRGVVRDQDIAFLIAPSRHVWMREAGRHEWKPTGVYVPEGANEST